MSFPKHLIVRVVACLCAACILAGCNTSDRRARSALNDYQNATALNDTAAARRALLQLVSAKDDVPDYWAELGRIEMASGELGQASYAFNRAYELGANAYMVKPVDYRAVEHLFQAITQYWGLECAKPELAAAR